MSLKNNEKPPSTIKLYEQYITTSDEWYPNYPDNKVRVSAFYWNPIYNSMLGITDKQVMTRICVWGNDDDGMERDCIHDLKDLKQVKENLLLEAQTLPEPITKKYLESIGFVRA